MTPERSNPFDLEGLIETKAPAGAPVTQPAAAAPASDAAPLERPSRAQIDRLAKDTGFVSRERPRMGRRLLTGRNRQLNLKVRDSDVDRFYKIADEERITLGEVFERALDALEAARRRGDK